MKGSWHAPGGPNSFKLSQNPDFADGRTDRQLDRRTHGRKVKLKSGAHILTLLSIHVANFKGKQYIF